MNDATKDNLRVWIVGIIIVAAVLVPLVTNIVSWLT